MENHSIYYNQYHGKFSLVYTDKLTAPRPAYRRLLFSTPPLCRDKVMNASDEKFITGIKLTGFGLEFSISENLTKNGWTVINNKYYIDDVQGSAREIDILAYKTALQNDIQIYTVLIISCKKSKENSWALLAKNKNLNDPNMDWTPVTIWSNQKILKLIIENFDWKKSYISSSHNLNSQLLSPTKHIFAFQELNKKKGTPQNDKAIFNSIISCMKSQDYEIRSLDERKKENSIYNFNLISVIDAPLLRINYGDNNPSIERIDSDIYVGSYIINRKEKIFRIHFITANTFKSHLSIYNDLHSHNIKQTSDIFDSYYIKCLENKKKVDLFIKDFNRNLRWDIYSAIKSFRTDDKTDLNDISLLWDKNKNCVSLSVEKVWDDAEVNMLNTNNEIKVKVASILRKIYQYEGDFYFEPNVPF